MRPLCFILFRAASSPEISQLAPILPSSAARIWKLTAEDWRNREKWHSYEKAAEEMLLRTWPRTAVWHLVEANDKYWARVKVLSLLVETLSEALGHVPRDPLVKSKRKRG